MSSALFRLTLNAGLALALSAVPAMAQGKGNSRGRGQGRNVDAQASASVHVGDRVRHGDHDRDGRPPGWSHGKKTGWGDCNLPPGLAKKRGCRDLSARGGHDRDHDRDHARGAAVRAQGSVTTHRRTGKRPAAPVVREQPE